MFELERIKKEYGEGNIAGLPIERLSEMNGNEKLFHNLAYYVILDSKSGKSIPNLNPLKFGNLIIPHKRAKIYPRQFGSLEESIEKNETIWRAFDLAHYIHGDKIRYSGKGYMEGHIIPAGEKAIEYSVYIKPERQHIAIAGVLGHDMIEDNENLTFEDVKDYLGMDVAKLIKYLTKENNDPTQLFEVGMKKPEPAFAAGIDRIANMGDVAYLPTQERRDIFSDEARDKYIPMLQKHGFNAMANELMFRVLLHKSGAKIYSPDRIVFSVPHTKKKMIITAVA